MNAASQLEAMRERLAETQANLANLKAERADLIRAIGERIGADATGGPAYDAKARMADQKAAQGLAVQIEQGETALEAIEGAIRDLTRREAIEEAADLAGQMRDIEGDGMQALAEFESAAQSFLDAANRLNGLQRDYGRVFTKRNRVLQSAGEAPEPTQAGGIPGRWKVGGSARLESKVDVLPRFTKDSSGLRAWWSW